MHHTLYILVSICHQFIINSLTTLFNRFLNEIQCYITFINIKWLPHNQININLKFKFSLLFFIHNFYMNFKNKFNPIFIMIIILMICGLIEWWRSAIICNEIRLKGSMNYYSGIIWSILSMWHSSRF